MSMPEPTAEQGAQGPSPGAASSSSEAPTVPDHQLLRRIGRGAYGEVWLARNVLGLYRAVKIVYRSSFEHNRPFEREFEGIQKFEPISRTHESQIDILHVGRNDEGGYFYYVMELADDAGRGQEGRAESGEGRAEGGAGGGESRGEKVAAESCE